MRTGRPKAALILTDEERQHLESLAHRSRSAPHAARRARIILACADGGDSNGVAKRLHVTPARIERAVFALPQESHLRAEGTPEPADEAFCVVGGSG